MGTNAKGWQYVQTTTPRSSEGLQEMAERKDNAVGRCSDAITFINLSNHPTEKWSEDQKAAAKIGRNVIVDIPFPQIDPNASLAEIEELAKDYFAKIVEHHKAHPPTTVHLMGEQTFCYQLASMIQKSSYQIKVLVSTTERVSTENPDGTKTSTFRFVRFRPLFDR